MNLKNNFQRLEALYQEALDESNKIKAEYEVKLIKADEDYTRIFSQNEVLKESDVQTMFKTILQTVNQMHKLGVIHLGTDLIMEL